MKTVIWGKCKTTFIQKWGNQSSVLPSIQYVEIGGVVVFSRIYNYRISKATFGSYIYLQVQISSSEGISKLIARPYKPPPSGDSARKRGRIEPNRVKTDYRFDCPETVRIVGITA
jgi:hypothetical protein